MAEPRPTAAEILRVVVTTGEEELERSTTALGFSGIAAGLAMGLSGLGTAVLWDTAGGPSGLPVSALLYPLGFIAVVIGRQQLFTENTLFPVVVSLDSRDHVANTARLWGVVLVANVVGALLFALLAMRSGALPAELDGALRAVGEHAADRDWARTFWSAVIAGWVIALMAWLVSATRLMAQIAATWGFTYLVGAAGLSHPIAGSGEILCAMADGPLTSAATASMTAATRGNAVGGVLMVSLLDHAQVIGAGGEQGRGDRSLDDSEREMGIRDRR